jgi:hypothetical protein
MVGLAGQLTPYSFQIGWETLTIVRVGEGKFFESAVKDDGWLIVQRMQLLRALFHWVPLDLYRRRD